MRERNTVQDPDVRRPAPIVSAVLALSICIFGVRFSYYFSRTCARASITHTHTHTSVGEGTSGETGHRA